DARRAAVLARALALFFQRTLEALLVQPVAALACDQLREVEREAERVVEPEDVLARNHRERLRPPLDRRPVAFRQGRRNLVEAAHPAVDRGEEALLLLPRGAQQMVAPVAQLGVRI